MSQKNKKVHSQSGGKSSVPFEWEKQPGVSKPITKPKDDQSLFHKKQENNLPPPPCWLDHNYKATSRKKGYLQTRPMISSSCSFQDPLRSCSKRGFGKQARFEQDPFLVAFKECTKSKSNPAKGGVGVMIKKSLLGLCCKRSCGVRDDALVNNQVLLTYE